MENQPEDKKPEQQEAQGLQDFFVEFDGGFKVNLKDLRPLTERDRRELKKTYNFDMKNYLQNDDEGEARLCLFILRKLRPTTTEDEVLDMPITQIQNICLYMIRKSKEEVKSPFTK